MDLFLVLDGVRGGHVPPWCCVEQPLNGLNHRPLRADPDEGENSCHAYDEGGDDHGRPLLRLCMGEMMTPVCVNTTHTISKRSKG